MHTGNLYIVSAPSGAGKTSLLKALLEKDSSLALSISHTTRKQRPGEQEGVHYYFISQEVFQEMVENDQFIEHAEVFGNFYGTASSNIARQRQQGKDVILEIDWQGAQQVRKLFADSLGIFILPPSKQALEQRLRNRGQDDGAIISRRMAEAVSEISHYNEFDYLLVNDDFEVALNELLMLITALRHKTSLQASRQKGLLQELLEQ